MKQYAVESLCLLELQNRVNVLAKEGYEYVSISPDGPGRYLMVMVKISK